MYSCTIRPRFNETDALGHISNTVLPSWFESARAPLFEDIIPSWTIANWPIILAHFEVDFLQQIFLGADVTITTQIQKVGNASFTVYHEAFQSDKKVASGNAVLVFFDFKTQKTTAIPDDIRAILESNLG
ncbi:acyl-CoA thioesterase [Saccharophagus degradans]|uniref:Thioesterase superfamily n=1 Tax=Saccharophagus degradans (strain 2-40 / ATCC 43961 / DSM 17024) TaxID=203122 RepID=Q21JL3_SACD2|nr:thioesterase family protein [Saccharophagus degradans]ABD81116.1 thioesterase superfamily [Saccharophagus degradans 2-40]MBU2985530.1 acyl-CoA thioesterase [Saccharophagus degradans]WGO96637.1 thioesterase family protein [Saccharophagus degradans]